MSLDLLADLDLLDVLSPRAGSPVVFCAADAGLDALDLECLFTDALFELPLDPAPAAADVDLELGTSPVPDIEQDELQWGAMLRFSATDMNRLKRSGRLSPDQLLELTRARRRLLNRGYSRASRQRRLDRHAGLRVKAELQRQVAALAAKVAALEAALAQHRAA